MVIPDDSALQQCPEAFDVVCVDLATHILMRLVIDRIVTECLMQLVVARAFIRGYEIDFLRNHLTDKTAHGFNRSIFDNLADHATLTRDRADHSGLVEWAATTLFLVPVTVFVLAAKIGFIYFYDPHQLLELRVFHRGAQSHAHIPSRPVRSRSDHPMDLQGAHALAAQHEVENLEPSEQRNFGFLEDGSSLERKSIGRAIVLAALFALPMPRTRLARVHVIVATTDALNDAIGPTASVKIRPARPLIGEQPVEVGKGHLADEARLGVSVVAHASEISAKPDGSQLSHNPQIFHP
jgi:hypothetical protein